MKQNDRKILHHIRRNARANLTSISRKTGIPVSTIFDRLRSHEGNLITRFTALLDFSALGYPVRLHVFMKAHPDQRTALRNYLHAHPLVNTLCRVNNGFDYLADCVFRTVKESEDFMDELEAKFTIVARQAFHVIDEIVREKVLAEEITTDL